MVRPRPPVDSMPEIEAAPGLHEWVMSTFVSQGGRLFNPDHSHLLDASIGFLWARTGFVKSRRLVLGQAEQVAFRAGGWQKARAEQQMVEWFGDIPDFLITLAADYCAECSDAEFCALVEHELYHIAQELDGFGAPAFTRDGMPKLKLRGHDVEEFVGVVRRYGASPDVQRLVEAASGRPEVEKLNIARACGTCLLKSA
ncbi:putative metallopeptidase [Ectopseudomonas oleovorans]|uniref:Putative phage metallopeptidase domain-containing protein n=1 Tax=Ectopseudomonas oleovorans TaxID=301 RepID=A0A3D9EXK7_ECTOL|nr:putative metallopeptidase [Pseudomonas oleovorans]RED06975.1 hypothetical protein DFO60_1481 [Pseudomonas oleovorans]